MAISPFSTFNTIRRAPVAPLQRKYGPFGGRRKSPFAPLEEPPTAPKPDEAFPTPNRGRKPVAYTPPSAAMPFTPPVAEEFEGQTSQVFDPTRADALTKKFEAENRVFSVVAPSRPVIGAPPSVGIQPKRASGTYEYFVGGRRFLTDSPAPIVIKPTREKDNAGNDLDFWYRLPNGDVQRAPDATTPLTITPRAIQETNSAFTRAFGALDPTQRDIYAGNEPTPAKPTPKVGVRYEPTEGRPGYQTPFYRDSDGKERVGTPERIPQAGLPTYRTVPTENPDVQQVERVTEQADGSYKVEPVRREWTEDALKRKQSSSKAFTEQQATSGGVAALNAGAAGAPLVRKFGEQGVTTFGPSAGFDPNAPSGSRANPYGPQGTVGSSAFTQNQASARAETDMMRLAARAPMAASRIMSDAQSGRLAQTAATPAGKAMLTSILAVLQSPLDRQRENPDDDTLVAEAIKRLQQVLAQRPQGQIFTRFQGNV